MKKLTLILTFIGLFNIANAQNSSYVYLELDKKLPVNITCNNYPIEYSNNGYVILHNLPAGENVIKIDPQGSAPGQTFRLNVQDGKSYGYKMLKASPNEYLLQDVVNNAVVRNSSSSDEPIASNNAGLVVKNESPDNSIKVITSESGTKPSKQTEMGVLEVLTADNQKETQIVKTETKKNLKNIGARKIIKNSKAAQENIATKKVSTKTKPIIAKTKRVVRNNAKPTYAMYQDGYQRRVEDKNYRKINKERRRIERQSVSGTSTPKRPQSKTSKVKTPKVKTPRVKTTKVKTPKLKTPKVTKKTVNEKELKRQKYQQDQELIRLEKLKAEKEKALREKERALARANKSKMVQEEKARIAAQKLRERELRTKEREAQESIKARNRLLEQEKLAQEATKKQQEEAKLAKKLKAQSEAKANELARLKQEEREAKSMERATSRKERKANRDKKEDDYKKYVDGIGKKVINPEPTPKASTETKKSKIDPKDYISTECPRIPLNSDVKRMVLSMKNKLDDEAKVNHFLKNAGTSCYTAPQIAYVMKNLDSQIWKYKLAKEMSSKIADPEHMDYITKLFNNSFKKKFDKLVN